MNKWSFTDWFNFTWRWWSNLLQEGKSTLKKSWITYSTQLKSQTTTIYWFCSKCTSSMKVLSCFVENLTWEMTCLIFILPKIWMKISWIYANNTVVNKSIYGFMLWNISSSLNWKKNIIFQKFSNSWQKYPTFHHCLSSTFFLKARVLNTNTLKVSFFISNNFLIFEA